MSWGGIFPLHTANKEASERAQVGEGQGPQACLCPASAGGLGQGGHTHTEPRKHKIALQASPGVLTSSSQSKGILLLNKNPPPCANCSEALYKESDLLASPPGNQQTERHSTGLGSGRLASRPECVALCWVT